jgi:hypothetical protein
MEREQPKTARKTRRRRIAISIAEPREYELTDDDWSALEEALGNLDLDVEIRSQIRTIVCRYFFEHDLEWRAPYLDDVLKRIAKIERAVEELQGLLSDERSAHIDSFIKAKIETAWGDYVSESSIYALQSALDDALKGLAFGRYEFEKDAVEGFEDGAAWQKLVRDLRSLMRQRGLPYGASQDRTKARSDEGSAFPRFVMALQQTFPDASLRRHSSDVFALAKAINRASPQPRKAVLRGDKPKLTSLR